MSRKLTQRELMQIAVDSRTDIRSVRKEIATPGSVRGDAGVRIRGVVDAALKRVGAIPETPFAGYMKCGVCGGDVPMFYVDQTTARVGHHECGAKR